MDTGVSGTWLWLAFALFSIPPEGTLNKHKPKAWVSPTCRNRVMEVPADLFPPLSEV